MRAIVCNAWGPPATLAVETLPDPVAGPGQVLVEVRAAGVNFPDVLTVQGKYQVRPPLPFTPGFELAGVVRAAGPGAGDWHPGDRVIAFTRVGAFAELALAPVEALVRMPDGLGFDVAAAVTLTYGTAHHALVDRGALRPGEMLLVLGAAGGVGLAAVELGKALGARVIAAAGGAAKLAVCRDYGADVLIDYERDDLREALRAATGGRGPDVVLDPVGGRFSEPALRALAWRGRHLVVGFAGGAIPALPWNLVLLKGASVVGVFWGDFQRKEPAAHAAAMARMLAWMAEGKLKPLVSRRYPLADTARALEDMAARRVTGKIVIVPAVSPASAA
jgi:NADPH2:quinone reductase